jgi:sec-independent protein translocase protein TatC
MPLVMFFLAKIGIVTGTYLRKSRKFAVVIILIIAGVITPGPDVISQMAVFLPLYLLYEISILLTAREERLRAKEDKEWS